MEELENFVMNELPEWDSNGYLDFIISAEKMLKSGMSKEVIKEILADLHSAVCSEYEE